MNIVLLSGGSGKRLWPLSNDTQSKQFLQLLSDGKGNNESMVQRVFRQIDETLPDSNIFISGNDSQLSAIRRQLGDVETVSEPVRADTFPAIVLSAAYLHFQKGISADESMIVLPIDVYADNGYFRKLSDVYELSNVFNIALLGVKPTYPSEKYGYISADGGKVTSFHEKPDHENAKKLLSDGALWNCGVFAMKITYILNKAKSYIDFSCYRDILEQYSSLPKISFDYEVLEKEHSIGCVMFDGQWEDLGTWNTLTDEMKTNVMGKNVQISADCENTHILNMLDTPVVALGLKNLVVVTSHDGILISDKTQSSSMKPYVEKINRRPMYERRQWGSYRVLDYDKKQSGSYLVKRLEVEAGKSVSYRYGNNRSETWIVLSGKGILSVDGVESIVGKGSVVAIPPGAEHSLLAAETLELVEVQTGETDLNENDFISG